jgi:two-component system, cell cycle response regulator DivK
VQTKKRILVIEDDELIADFLRRLLEDLDQSVVVAHDGQEGLDRARSCPPDLILLDLSLPIVDGWELARQLKTDPVTWRIPLIAVTGANRYGEGSEGEDGLDGFVEKPFEVRDLEDKLLSFLTRV